MILFDKNNPKKRKIVFRFFIVVFILLIAGFLIPQKAIIPVQNASSKDWNKNSFWAEPWGKSIVHKGIDIFAPKGRLVISSVSGILIFKGYLEQGGLVIAVLDSKWRIHYYAHLNSIDSKIPFMINQGEVLGEVGDSGNAKGKPPHLH